MKNKIYAIHIAVHEPRTRNLGWAYFFRGEECNSYLVKPGSRRYHRAIMAQMALIDPRTHGAMTDYGDARREATTFKKGL